MKKSILKLAELKQLGDVKSIHKKSQKTIKAGLHISCPPGQCGQIIFPGPDWFCTPC